MYRCFEVLPTYQPTYQCFEVLPTYQPTYQCFEVLPTYRRFDVLPMYHHTKFPENHGTTAQCHHAGHLYQTNNSLSTFAINQTNPTDLMDKLFTNNNK